jgi:hypothetical protein
MRTNLALLASVAFLIASSSSASATTAPSQRQEFIAACVHAFNQSNGGAAGEDRSLREVGRKICDCTASESKHQGVTPASLKSETAKIQADPKYKISDPKLLAAFQYCSIETLRD